MNRFSASSPILAPLIFVFVLVIAVASTCVLAQAATAQREQLRPGDAKFAHQLERAARVQGNIDALAQRHQLQRNRLERSYKERIAQFKDERSRILRHAPEFWYYALRSSHESKHFLSSQRHQAMSSAGSFCGVGSTDQCVSNDHDFLKLFLSDVRCFQVDPGQFPRGAEADDSSVPSNSNAAPLENHNDGGSAELRVEIEFASNNAFQNRRIARQVPAHFRRDMLASDDEFSDDDDEKNTPAPHGRTAAEELNARKRAAFGLGTELKWMGTAARTALLGDNATEAAMNEMSFFALFDRASLEAAVNNNKQTANRTEIEKVQRRRTQLQLGLAALVRVACGSLEANPLPFHEKEKTEEDLLARLHAIRNGALRFDRDSASANGGGDL